MMEGPVINVINRALLTDSPLGPLGLWAVASSVVVPLTMYCQGYSFSVGYGFSVAAMALYLMKTFSNYSNPLVLATAFYGLRLGSFLQWRLIKAPQKAAKLRSFGKTPRLKRIPFAASLALFYALMTTPVLYVSRATASTNVASTSIIFKIGTILAWAGAILEAVADQQKFIIKQRSAKKGDENKTFVGPTSGVYQITRHPNYTGEVCFWVGVFVSGTPFFGCGGSIANTVVGWLCSILGIYGISSLMNHSAKRLDEEQKENYGGQDLYDSWRSTVKAPIYPFVNSE
jgi:steroid 5-alpha reductase family enzyme